MHKVVTLGKNTNSVALLSSFNNRGRNLVAVHLTFLFHQVHLNACGAFYLALGADLSVVQLYLYILGLQFA